MTEAEFRALLDAAQIKAYNAPAGKREYDILFEELWPYFVGVEKS